LEQRRSNNNNNNNNNNNDNNKATKGSYGLCSFTVWKLEPYIADSWVETLNVTLSLFEMCGLFGLKREKTKEKIEKEIG